jgi:NAD(P)-dependent dehydrogenase (short-subunit alcohol dehydrogenase family)
MRRVALITGARRGIGRAIAAALTASGLEVVTTSRTPAPEAVFLDLADRSSIDAALDEVTRRCGSIDVLVNNALCDQPGSQATIETMDFAAFESMMVGEVVNTAYLTRQVLAHNPSRQVTIVNVGSAAAEHTPRRPVGEGGWAWSYSASKAALHRLAPFLQLEFGAERVRAFTLDPGFVRTEALLERLGDIAGSAPPELPARVVEWLVNDDAADRYLGGYLHAQQLAAEMGWSFP